MRHSLTVFFVLIAAALLVFAGLPAAQPPKGVTGERKIEIDQLLLDPDRTWDLLAKGEGTILIANATNLKPYLEQFADANGISNGRLIRHEFYAFVDLMAETFQPAGPGGVYVDKVAIQRFIIADKNSDGFLIEDEMPSDLQEVWQQYDMNLDGLIDQVEYIHFVRMTYRVGPRDLGLLAQLDTSPVGAQEEVLRSAGLTTESDALVEFFLLRSASTVEPKLLIELAKKLGADDANVRISAAAKLIAYGPWAIPALRHVINDLESPLAAGNARLCLDKLDGKRGSELTMAAARLLMVRPAPGATEALLAFLPLAEDQPVVDAVKAALHALAAAADKPPAILVAALRDPVPLRRVVAVEILAAGGQPEVVPDVRKAMGDPNPQVRLRAALTLLQHNDEQAVGMLIDMLAELPATERRPVEQALQQLAGAWSPNPGLTGDDEFSRKIRREVWAGWWRAIDGPALLTAFQRRTLSKAELAKVQALIEQLGHNTFAKREQAVAELTAAGYKVKGLLQEAAKNSDLELARRAEVCLRQIALNQEKEKLPSAAPRLLAIRKPAVAADTLLDYLPFTDDSMMKAEIGNTLKKLAVVGGKADPAVLTALADPLPMRRTAAAEALAGAPGAEARQAVRKLLADADAQVRLRVAVALVQAQDKDAVPVLIGLVGELPRSQAWEAEQMLVRIAGAKAPTLAGGDDIAARNKRRDAWQAWWDGNKASASLANLQKSTFAAGLTVVAELGPKGRGNPLPAGAINPPIEGPGIPVAGQPVNPIAGTDRLVAIDRDGKARWQIENLDIPIDFQLLPGDRVLIAEYGSRRVSERDLGGKIIWQTPNLPGNCNPINIQRLANGNTFIAAYSGASAQSFFLMEVDRTGQTVSNLEFKNKGGPFNPALAYLRAAYKMADGQTVCLISNNLCIRLDATGKEVQRFQLPATILTGTTYLGNIDVTAKGHVVYVQANNTVTEFDPDGKVVWQSNVNNANRLSRLDNGNTLIASTSNGVFELDNTGRTVWQYRPPQGYQPLRARKD